MTKTVLFGKEARDKILLGVKKITDAVRVTMGASGKCVLIGESYYGQDGMLAQFPTIVTKDGFTVTKHFSLPDLIENRGAIMIKEAAMKTVMMAGDATTCTCVLADAIVSEGVKLIDAGANSQELKKGIDCAVEKVVEKLKEISISVKGDDEKIFHVATVSANNDQSIGRLISEAFKKIGHEGIIDVEAGKGMTTEIKVADGYKFDKSWVSPLFINQREKQIVEFLEPYILLYDKQIIHHTQIQRALELVVQEGKGAPLLIICEDAREQGLAFVVSNVIQQRIKCCIVKAPSFGDGRREEMEDIALLTGGTYIADIRGLGVKEMEMENFGRAKKVVVTKDETIIIGGAHNGVDLENALNELRMNLAQAKTEDDQFPIEKRIARLTGGVAVIQVGAATETELNEKLDRFDDSVRSTKAALTEGIVAGGGTAFIEIASDLELTGAGDFRQGQKIILDILSKPFFQMAENAGVKPDPIYDKVLAAPSNFGYNTKSGKVENLIESGIIDSTKALRCALINAASIAGMILISEALIEAAY